MLHISTLYDAVRVLDVKYHFLNDFAVSVKLASIFFRIFLLILTSCEFIIISWLFDAYTKTIGF